MTPKAILFQKNETAESFLAIHKALMQAINLNMTSRKELIQTIEKTDKNLSVLRIPKEKDNGK